MPWTCYLLLDTITLLHVFNEIQILLNYYMFSMRYSYWVSISGEWLLVIVYMFRDQLQELMGGQVGLVRPGGGGNNASAPSLSSQLESHHLRNVHWFIVMAVSTSFVLYYGLAYGWHYYYYVNRRHLVILIFCIVIHSSYPYYSSFLILEQILTIFKIHT